MLVKSKIKQYITKLILSFFLRKLHITLVKYFISVLKNERNVTIFEAFSFAANVLRQLKEVFSMKIIKHDQDDQNDQDEEDDPVRAEDAAPDKKK